MAEAAHYVRCIPYRAHENDKIWCSPDYLLTLRVGSIEEHALLMASLFRACKYESTKELEED